MEREVEVEPGVTVWVQDLPPHDGADPDGVFLLLAGANASGATWPDELVDLLRDRYRVLRPDHRDTGRSTRAFDDHPYGPADLAADALRVLDACDAGPVHAVGHGLGGALVQLLALDAPHRLAGAALLGTAALDAGRAGLPGPSREVQRMWQELHDPRDEPGELAWRVEYQRRLHGHGYPFDEQWFTERERRVLAHAGRTEPDTAHPLADADGLDRGDELGAVAVPTLVVEGPEDPVHPPPHAAHLAERIGPAARLVTVEGLGHTLPGPLLAPLAELLLAHADDAAAQRAQR